MSKCHPRNEVFPGYVARQGVPQAHTLLIMPARAAEKDMRWYDVEPNRAHVGLTPHPQDASRVRLWLTVPKTTDRRVQVAVPKGELPFVSQFLKVRVPELDTALGHAASVPAFEYDAKLGETVRRKLDPQPRRAPSISSDSIKSWETKFVRANSLRSFSGSLKASSSNGSLKSSTPAGSAKGSTSSGSPKSVPSRAPSSASISEEK